MTVSGEVSPIERFDATVDRAFDRLRGNPMADRVAYEASQLGEFSLVWQLAGVARAAVDPSRARESVRLSVLLGAESLLVNQGVKRLFRRRRPVHHGDHPFELRTPLTSSFPSGHASAGFFAATLLSRSQPVLAPAWYALAAVVAASRIHVRAHHASDVVGGAALGVALAVLAERLWPR